MKKLVEFLSLKIHSQRFHTSFFGSLAARFCPLPLRFVNNCLANSRFQIRKSYAKQNIIKLGSSLTFTSIAILKQRNLPFSRLNAFSITILHLIACNQKTFHGNSYLPLDIRSLRKAKADRRSLREYKWAQKSHHQ